MSGEIDALGELATAGLAARALDTPAAQHAEHGLCPNCGADVGGRFCANCGQPAHLHRSLIHVVEEFLHGITHFDGKAWQTLPMLVFRPGTLTRDYIFGKRARYIPPVSLFLLVVFLMFFVFSFIHVGPGLGTNLPMTPTEAKAALPGAEKAIRDIDREIAAAVAKGATDDAKGARLARRGLVVARDRIAARARNEITAPLDLPGELRHGVETGDLKVSLGAESLNIKAKDALKNPELTLYKVQGKLYKFSFLLVPLSLPWLWLLFFWKRGVRMYDHAVFSLYSISFMSLVFTVASLLFTWHVESGAVYGTLLILVPLAHMFVQLKGAYSLRTVSALWRTGALATLSFTTLVVYATLMIVLGIVD